MGRVWRCEVPLSSPTRLHLREGAPHPHHRDPLGVDSQGFRLQGEACGPRPPVDRHAIQSDSPTSSRDAMFVTLAAPHNTAVPSPPWTRSRRTCRPAPSTALSFSRCRSRIHRLNALPDRYRHKLDLRDSRRRQSMVQLRPRRHTGARRPRVQHGARLCFFHDNQGLAFDVHTPMLTTSSLPTARPRPLPPPR